MALMSPRGVSASRSSCFSFSLLLSGLILCVLPHLEALEEGDPCTLKGNLAGVCQGSSKCVPRINKYIETKRLTPSDIPSCGLSTREEIVCCPVAECCGDDQRQGTTTKSPLQPAPSPRTDVPRPSVQACRAIEQRQLEYGLTEHILDGIEVDPAYYPHMAAIAFNQLGNIIFGCGGSLISTRHVLTAAHCVNDQDKTPVFVRLGTVNIEHVSEHRQDINITDNIRIHPDYVSTSKYNDIAILELAEEVRLTNYTYPACLETELFDPPSNASIYVAGWGVMNTTTRRTSKILLRAPLTVVPLAQCNDSFAAQPLSHRYLERGIIDSLLCAADLIRGTKDACQGDSGGPLVLERDKENNKYSVMGVISSGFGCATTTPGLYTRVASYLDFIEGIVWPNGFV
ncbi:PREDICTED: serine protease persephone-like [Drosophila arizonae]|uniref:Serine protease persephone-like n=1 Tax=Drosophila arizonae TaxID=7263 RepID=A0ABM1PYX7_DROAR|nr:PREDICTED: serine protease persephone-like [Drosophila arizonae]